MRKGTMRDRAIQGAAKMGASSQRVARADEEASAAHPRVPEIVPAGWLDHLLVTAMELPLLRGERAVLDSALDGVAAIVPAYAVGVCFVPEPGSATREQIVVKRLPADAIELTTGVDPTRIFPGLVHEYVAPIHGSTTGSTLHVASNDDDLDPAGSAAVRLIERAAMAIGRALTNARAVTFLVRTLERSESADDKPGLLRTLERSESADDKPGQLRTLERRQTWESADDNPAGAGGENQEAHAHEQRMLQADKLANFGQIAAGMVHELNNPLTSIVAYSDYLVRKSISRGAAGDADDLERLRRISESATRMLHFTRDLVSYARPSTGPSGPVVLHGAIDQAIAFCEHVLSAARVRVERCYGGDVLTVRAVGEQLVQVFVNLLTNASHAAPEREGRVVVTTGLTDGSKRVTIVVEDNGSGIAPEHLPRVFVPFFTTKGDRQGTGLGLSIVKSIVENHHGAIRVESQLGHGTRFVIELPTAK
jgi:signal transduction histidine kinase